MGSVEAGRLRSEQIVHVLVGQSEKEALVLVLTAADVHLSRLQSWRGGCLHGPSLQCWAMDALLWFLMAGEKLRVRALLVTVRLHRVLWDPCGTSIWTGSLVCK
jgi:hypothetical protein